MDFNYFKLVMAKGLKHILHPPALRNCNLHNTSHACSGSELNTVTVPIKKMIPHKAPSEKAIRMQLERIIQILEQENFIPDVITGHWASPQLEIISELKKRFNCKTACVLHGTGYITNPRFNTNEYLKGIDHLGCRSLAQSNKIKDILKLGTPPFVCYSGVPDGYLENYDLNTDKFTKTEEVKFTYVG